MYDLLVDTGSTGIQRVQVKSSTKRSNEVGLTRSVYRPDQPSRMTTGFVRQEPYQPGLIDYFFVVLGTGEMYLLPYDVIGYRASVKLGHRYERFKIAQQATPS